MTWNEQIPRKTQLIKIDKETENLKMQINTLKAVFQPVHLKYEKVTRVLKSPHALWPKSYKLWAALTIYSSMPYTYYPFLLHYNMKKIYALKNIKKKKG